MSVENFRLPVVDLKATGENIKKLRVSKGISVKEMQDVLGFTSPQAIYKWQWGETLPDINNLLALSEMLDTELKDILVTYKDIL